MKLSISNIYMNNTNETDKNFNNKKTNGNWVKTFLPCSGGKKRNLCNSNYTS